MSSDIPLTRKQQEIYEFLLNHEDSFAQPPSLDELCRAMNLKSRGSLHKHIQALTEAGLLEPANRKRRGIRLHARTLPDRLQGLPLVGYIAAGRPIEAIETPESIAVPTTAIVGGISAGGTASGHGRTSSARSRMASGPGVNDRAPSPTGTAASWATYSRMRDISSASEATAAASTCNSANRATFSTSSRDTLI